MNKAPLLDCQTDGGLQVQAPSGCWVRKFTFTKEQRIRLLKILSRGQDAPSRKHKRSNLQYLRRIESTLTIWLDGYQLAPGEHGAEYTKTQKRTINNIIEASNNLKNRLLELNPNRSKTIESEMQSLWQGDASQTPEVSCTAPSKRDRRLFAPARTQYRKLIKNLLEVDANTWDSIETAYLFLCKGPLFCYEKSLYFAIDAMQSVADREHDVGPSVATKQALVERLTIAFREVFFTNPNERLSDSNGASIFKALVDQISKFVELGIGPATIENAIDYVNDEVKQMPRPHVNTWLLALGI